jgi:tetratricopeptide (TPR) repeat protein
LEEAAGDVADQGEAAADAVTEYVPTVDLATEYLDAIDHTESLSSAYSTELADLYLGLGKTLLDKKEYEGAKEAFQQGMQIVRVNYGLNSPDQTNYLFAIADIETYTDNRNSADDVLQNIYSIHARNYGENTAGMLPVLKQLMNWYEVNRPMNLGSSRYVDMEIPAALANRMAAIMEKEKGLAHPETAAVYRQIGQIYWRSAEYLLGRGISVEPGIIISTGAPPQNANTRGISIKSLINNGRDALTKVAESVGSNEDRSPVQYAEAIAQLGDWNLSFGRKQTASLSYQQAYKVLAEGGQMTSQADAYFGDPIPVRFMDEKLRPIVELVPDVNVPELEISMTVTEGGRPLDVKILNPPANTPKDSMRKMRRMVSVMRFRPRLANGIPQRAKNFVWRLPLASSELSQ